MCLAWGAGFGLRPAAGHKSCALSPRCELVADCPLKTDKRGWTKEPVQGQTRKQTSWVSCLNMHVLSCYWLNENSRRCPAEVFPSLSGSRSAPGFSKFSLLGTSNCQNFLSLPVTHQECLRRGRNPKAAITALHFGASSKTTCQLSEA